MNNLEKLIIASVGPAQDIENALKQMLLYRFVDTATGAQLEQLGSIVGQSRGGLVDDDYRRYLRARIVANFSKGRVEDLIKVVDLVVYDADAYIELTPFGAATERLFVREVFIADDLATVVSVFVGDTKASGARIVLEWSEHPPAQTFTLDGQAGQGLDDGHFANVRG